MASDMTPSLANRSFLYGNNAGSSGHEVVLEALKHRLQDTSPRNKKQKPVVPPKPPYLITSLKNTRNVLRFLEPAEVKPAISTPIIPQEPATLVLENGHHSDSDTCSNHRSSTSSVYDYSCLSIEKPKKKTIVKESKKCEIGEDVKKKSRDYTFAKNVLNYVPITSRRYYKKSRKLATKSLSLKSLNEGLANKCTGGSRSATKDSDTGTLKTRSLSREELKYVTISLPSNFTHVASATRKKLMTSDDPKFVHEPKYVDLRSKEIVEYAEIGLPVQRKQEEDDHIEQDKDEEEVQVRVNNSFLESWARQSKVENTRDSMDEEPDYTEMELPLVRTTQEACEEKNSIPTSTSSISSSSIENDTYDEVESSSCRGNQDYEHVYDDVVSMLKAEVSPLREEAPPESNPENKPDEDEPSKDALEGIEQEEEDIYDHVGLPMRRAQSDQRDQQERVNSLYVGTNLASSQTDKESEWEDLDDPVYANIIESKPAQPEPSHPTPKKKGGPRWARNKVRRHCSRASRKSSARSTSRTRTRVAKAEANVAVSLGTGSILLLGPIGEDHQIKPLDPGIKNEESRGLVQLRLLLVGDDDDIQEASLYVEDSSDDSNYETLETYESDDFSDSDHELPATRPHHLPGLISLDQAPYRAVPAPPREPILSNSLVRPMKMLRRTWSITKGSLGRHVMRRRTSVDHAQSPVTPTDSVTSPGSSSVDMPRKYFSFKKHFRKSQTSAALSTFYLDKETAAQEEPIYSNGDWYKEVGLYAPLQRPTEPPPAPPAPGWKVVDHYSVLAEEPLYQFYTAAATRVAFESDSDGYEEVEELSPSTATTELARPGHRTLWCQTPQVINKGLLPDKKVNPGRSADLQTLFGMMMPLVLLSFRSKAYPHPNSPTPEKLTMEERKIQEAKFEILTSEASYLNSLRVLENEFASNQELVHEVLSSSEWEKLFGAVPNVLLSSERFLAELESIWHEDPMLAKLPELLLKHGEKSADVYVNYCSNQVSIDTTLKELRARKGFKFLETVSRIEMHPACQHLSLHSFLMLPMQRITRLPLLADAVLSKLSVEHPERLSWERVLASLSDIVGKCNEGARLAERRNEMDALARKLEYPAKMEPVSLHDKELIRSGTVTQLSTKADTEYKLTFGKKFQKTPLMLMLLTDYLLVAKLKSNSNEETYSVIESCKRSLVALESAPEDSPFAGRHAMVLTLLENHAGRQVEYVLTCDNDTEKERWLDAVSPPKPTCVGETLYESWDCPQVMALHSYPPTQPDELALQPGDVINVLRKMNDGWLFGEKLLDGEQGWFPGNFTKEVASEHVRARNLRQRHRLLALSGSVLQRKAKQSLSLH